MDDTVETAVVEALDKNLRSRFQLLQQAHWHIGLTQEFAANTDSGWSPAFAAARMGEWLEAHFVAEAPTPLIVVLLENAVRWELVAMAYVDRALDDLGDDNEPETTSPTYSW